MSKKNRYNHPIDAIQDSIERNQEIAHLKAISRDKKEVEFVHFKNIVMSRLGNDPAVVRVVNTWRQGKDPAYCEIQIINAKNWSKQELADIENLYNSFKIINEELWDAERKYGSNPEVRALIDTWRRSSDVRTIPFERKLSKILKGDE